MSSVNAKGGQVRSPQQRAAATRALVALVGAQNAADMRGNHVIPASRKPGNPKRKRVGKMRGWGPGGQPVDTNPLSVNAVRRELPQISPTQGPAVTKGKGPGRLGDRDRPHSCFVAQPKILKA